MKFNGMERRFAPEEISAMVLRKIKTIAEGHLNSIVKNAVITVPAYFNNVQRQAVKEAATIAGLHVMQLMNEPTAALVAYGIDAATYNSSTPKKILIFYLGGHSLEISLLSVKNGLVRLQVLGGDENLGGRDFDSSLVDYCAEQLRLKHNRSIHNAQVALSNLRMECERAKIHLSSTKETKVIVDSLYERFHFIPNISRCRFEYINARLFVKCIKAVEKCLLKAGLKREEVDHVVLAGSSTRIPKVRKTIQNFFSEKEVYATICPEHVVAYGAAVQAAVLIAEKIDRLQLNLTPLSIGVATRFGAKLVVVPRNTRISFRKEVVYRLREVNNTTSIQVYLGERPNILENLLLGELFFGGMPHAWRESVTVCFAMDDSGILKVSAKHQKTGSKSELIIDKEWGSQLGKNEMERMLIDAERFSLQDGQFIRNFVAREALANQVYDMREKVRKEKLKIQEIEQDVEDAIAWLDGNDTAPSCLLEQKLNDLKNNKKLNPLWGFVDK